MTETTTKESSTDAVPPVPSPLPKDADLASPIALGPADSPAEVEALNVEDPALYINRELSWIEFNARVLGESFDEDNQLLERVRFLSIFSTNLDEFFMVRVSGLRRQLEAGVVSAPADGMTPVQQLSEIRKRLLTLSDTATDCWHDDLKPKLRDEGILVLSYDQLKKKQRKLLRRHFKNEIFPVLTPLAFDPGHPFPHISSLSLNLAIVIEEEEGRPERFARLKVPQSLPRLLRVPDEERAEDYTDLGLWEVKAHNFVWIEEVIVNNLDLLFPGLKIKAAHPFRVTRDADQDIEEDEASDLLTTMAEVVEQRHFGSAIRLEVERTMPELIRDILCANLKLQPFQVFTGPGPIGLAGVAELTEVDRSDLKYRPFLPTVPPALTGEESVFTRLRKQDLLLYHPYDSFTPVVHFLEQAAVDPKVIAIKQTLYRTGPNSPIVAALSEARQNGKQVSVLVELKARFDEENNITWARALESVGVHVAYGIVGLKTHAKLCLVVRREDKGIRRYVHISTGNYNPVTSRVYTDLGLFTADEKLAEDVSDLFNALTGYSKKESYRKLLVAPIGMRRQFLERIDREIASHERDGNGHLAFKINALVDPETIAALYRASQAGVKVDLQVRGVCCLRPGVAGVSENVIVSSVVGRFLEHTRIYYFRNGGDEEILIGSADLMPRNLEGRVEALVPVADPSLKRFIRDDILFLHLRDTAKAHRLQADGSYKRLRDSEAEPFDSQSHLLQHGGGWRFDEKAG